MAVFLREYNQRYGAISVLTSHYMADIRPRVLVIHQGQLIYDGSLDELIDNFAPRRVQVNLPAPA